VCLIAYYYSEPTYVDAVIFSYIHCILSMPQIVDGEYSEEERKQAATLSKLVRKHDNLVKYAKSIYEKWLK
jgi:metaxin